MNLEISDLEVFYGKIRAIKGISIRVNEGEIVTLIGANGAGKTTTLKTISGLRKVTQGKIVFDGEDISNMSVHERVDLGISQASRGARNFSWHDCFGELGDGKIPSQESQSRDERGFSASI